MSTGNVKKSRSSRVARLDLPPSLLEATWNSLQRRDVLLRLGICVAAATVIWAATGAGAPPFPHRQGDTPARHIVAKTRFEIPDELETNKAKDQAVAQTPSVYEHTPDLVVNLREDLKNKVALLTQAGKDTDTKRASIWQEFALVRNEQAKPRAVSPQDAAAQLVKFRDALAAEGELDRLKQAIDAAFAPIERSGLLDALPTAHVGNQTRIRVFVKGNTTESSVVPVNDVLIAEAGPALKVRLTGKVKSIVVLEHIYAFLKPKLQPTLRFDEEATKQAQADAKTAVEPRTVKFEIGDVLAKAGEPLSEAAVKLLEKEHQAAMPGWMGRVQRSLAQVGMYVALFTLCGYYIYFRERRIMLRLPRLATLMAVVVITILLSKFFTSHLRAEMVPLLLLGMTLSIAYHQELALLLSAAVGLAIVFTLGYGLASYVTLVASVSVAVGLLGRVRSRRKLIYVGLAAGAVASFTTLGVGILTNEPLDLPLLTTASWGGFWVVVAAFLMTGLLPFIESLFGVQTDLSLIELGDVSHPLLQELVRRAPGTYNHSINVASIGEAAAEAIGAHGLLVRVGSYFHDIGKMLKPDYYVENQGQHGSRHEDLVPAMSTLIIIAHVKDGADLARQHHLPLPIIDFIQQHHGTTLVEYFYGRAAAQHEQDPDTDEPDETHFRYPGPKPQTKEAAVLMIADAVESASRSLVEPAPARIEGLVHDMAMKRLLDGQFEECGLTLQELHTVEESLVKSLVAMYHGRVKYPDQR
ncbi:MAG: HDIG domain-containing metalloprotein, partial [Pirellulales bacterium]